MTTDREFFVRQFVELWAGFAGATILVELYNHRGGLPWPAAQRAVITGLLFALLMSLYFRWRERRTISSTVGPLP